MTLDTARDTQLGNTQELRSSVEAIHKQASKSAQSTRASARIPHSSFNTANYDIGDFVLVAKREFRG
jgi:hypothetical protein